MAAILLVILLANYYLPDFRDFASPSFVREYLLSLGNWVYLVYVLLFLFSIPLPIPSTPVAIAGGYVFGMVIGTALTLIATLIGASIAFYLVRYYGEPLLEKMVSRHHIRHFQHIFRKRGINGALIAYAVPVFPSDSINFILGLSRIKYHSFLLIVIIGSLPRYVLITAFGQELLAGFTWKTIIVPILVALYLLIAIFREKIKKIIFKELRELEKEAKVIEKDVEKEVKWVEEEVGWKKHLIKQKKSDVLVKRGKISGKGVFANRNFRKGEKVIKYKLTPLTEKAFNHLSKSERNFVHKQEGVRYLYSSPERYVNHSTSPNTIQDIKNRCDLAKRYIKRGEEITTDSTKDDVA